MALRVDRHVGKGRAQLCGDRRSRHICQRRGQLELRRQLSHLFNLLIDDLEHLRLERIAIDSFVFEHAVGIPVCEPNLQLRQ
ncbi:MAG: hypothetical protein PW896_01320 [Pseudomonas sp.]|uniref:hypothetical protein n=1 Tax=Pseudomonas sp. TaxID=306 RepID=UPI00239F6390|nr:hypothetical protein [Pseudomonas sp.]MDE1193847.1 hypothetical protein [Pseudomonas sp.]